MILFFVCGKQVDSDFYYWNLGRQVRNGVVGIGDQFSCGYVEYEVILGYLGDGVQEVFGNKD